MKMTCVSCSRFGICDYKIFSYIAAFFKASPIFNYSLHKAVYVADGR